MQNPSKRKGDMAKKILIPNEQEANDFEILLFAMNSKSFEFLNDPAEDIYQPDDGESV